MLPDVAVLVPTLYRFTFKLLVLQYVCLISLLKKKTHICSDV